MYRKLSFSVLVIVVLAACAWLPSVQYPVGYNDTSPGTNPAYADRDGDCFVPAQGDPLWDEHYAQNVNPENCSAVESREQADLLIKEQQLREEEAKNLAAQTEQTRWGTRLILIIAAICGLFLLVGLLSR